MNKPKSSSMWRHMSTHRSLGAAKTAGDKFKYKVPSRLPTGKTRQHQNPRKVSAKTVKVRQRQNPKKKAAKKKNPRDWTPPKGKTPRAMFLRKQKRNGASKKQAIARWKFAAASKKRRKNPSKKKATTRRPKARAVARRRNPPRYKPRFVKLKERIGSFKLVVPEGEYDDTFEVYSPSGTHIGRVSEMSSGLWDAQGPGKKGKHGYTGRILTVKGVPSRKAAVEVLAGVRKGNPRPKG